jgi:hypothetical protein
MSLAEMWHFLQHDSYWLVPRIVSERGKEVRPDVRQLTECGVEEKKPYIVFSDHDELIYYASLFPPQFALAQRMASISGPPCISS